MEKILNALLLLISTLMRVKIIFSEVDLGFTALSKSALLAKKIKEKGIL